MESITSNAIQSFRRQEFSTPVMHDRMYLAAALGLWEPFESLNESLDRVMTISKNTILHIHITCRPVQRKERVQTAITWRAFSIVKSFANYARRAAEARLSVEAHLYNLLEQQSMSFVEKILNKCPALVAQTNNKGETPLHVAARFGHQGIARALLDKSKNGHDPESGAGLAKQMLRMATNEKDTALHEAARFNHFEVVKILTNEDPEFVYFGNHIGETPLYIAAERGYKEVVEEILNTCKSVAYHGPEGKTALHAAVYCRKEEMMEIIRDGVLEKTGIDLTEVADDQGWIPLHYAAHFGYLSIVRSLLDCNKLTAYIQESKGQKTALLIAARCNHYKVVNEILSKCQDCCELVDQRGQNLLHIMMDERSDSPYPEFICFNNLLNERDVDGNTPLHLSANKLFWAPNIIYNPRVDIMASNYRKLNAMDIAASSQGILEIFKRCLLREYKELGLRPGWSKVIKEDKNEEKKRDIEKNKQRDDHSEEEDHRYREYLGYKGMSDLRKEQTVKEIEEAKGPLLVVATLIATVTFAAGFTLPGGYKSDAGPEQGSAILTRNAAFQAFVVANTIAMMFSSCAVFSHLYMESMKGHFDEIFLHFSWALLFTHFAMAAMVLAFIMGTYAVIPHLSVLAISICVVGCFLVVYFIYLSMKSMFFH